LIYKRAGKELRRRQLSVIKDSEMLEQHDGLNGLEETTTHPQTPFWLYILFIAPSLLSVS
jgi:hypothetical protein